MWNRTLVIVLFFLWAPFLCGQRNNYQIQNSTASFGFFIGSGTNWFINKDVAEKSALGFQSHFGLSYMKHKPFMAFESGIAYHTTTLKHREERLLDSFNLLSGYRINGIGIPINLAFKFSQNRKRTVINLGINPVIATSTRLLLQESNPGNKNANTIFPTAGNGPYWHLSLNLGLGRTYDISRDVMVRIEINYAPGISNLYNERFLTNMLGVRLLFMNFN